MSVTSTQRMIHWILLKRFALLRESLVLLLFTGITLVYTWPLARLMDAALPDAGDPLLNLWILDWNYYAATHLLPLFQAPIFHPSRTALAFSENLFGISLFTLPLYLAGAKPIFIYNIAQIAGFVGSAYGAYLLARMLIGRTAPAVAAGIFFGFVPFRFDHLVHLQIVWSIWLPLLLAGLILVWKKPTRLSAAILCGAFFMNGASNIHWLLFGSVAILLVIPILATTSSDRRQFLLCTSSALIIGCLLLLPLLLPYREVSHRYEMKRVRAENVEGSATLRDWLAASPRSEVYANLKASREGRHERRLFPGLIAPALLLITLLGFRRESLTEGTEEPSEHESGIASRGWLVVLDAIAIVAFGMAIIGLANDHARLTIGTIRLASARSYAVPFAIALASLIARWSVQYPAAWRAGTSNLGATVRQSRFSPGILASLSWLVIGTLGSFGLNGFFHEFLFERVEIFQSVRTPARWAMLAYVGLAIAVATGIVVLGGRRRLREIVVSVFVSALLLFELRPRPIRWFLEEPSSPPVYEWLRTLPGAVVAELPLSNDGGVEVQYLFRQTGHHQKLLNGISGFEPPEHRELVALGRASPISPRFIHLLEQFGCSVVVVHTDSFTTEESDLQRLIRGELSSGRLIFLRRFDHDVHGDYAFAVIRNANDTIRSARLIETDADGISPQQHQERFLSGEVATSPSRLSGHLDRPLPYTEVRGPLVVSGWAYSPHGIREVIVHLQNRAWSGKASLVPKGDGQSAGFLLEFKARPKSVKFDTDVQVEIVDRPGARQFLRDTWVDWTPRKTMHLTQWDDSRLQSLSNRLKLLPAEVEILRRTPEELAGIAYPRLLCECDDETFIRTLYDHLLGRPVDEEGMSSKRRKLREGKDRRDLVDEVATSKEFAELHGIREKI